MRSEEKIKISEFSKKSIQKLQFAAQEMYFSMLMPPQKGNASCAKAKENSEMRCTSCEEMQSLPQHVI